MDASQEKSYHRLVTNLEELTKLYRTLLDLIRKEKEILVSANVEKLNESNQSKEALLYKIRAQDSIRERYAQELANLIGLTNTEAAQPRLLEISKKLQNIPFVVGADRLRAIHATLELLVKRSSDLNKENEEYTQSALKSLNGAINNIKDTLGGKKTYGRQGANVKMSEGPDRAGNFVSKEA